MGRGEDQLRILAFEPYDTGSHRAVRESISRHSSHQWLWFTRPGRAWKWRMRLAAIEMIDEAQAAGAFAQPIDLIFATSLMSIADLRAVLPAEHRNTPIVVYMHENQATYPLDVITWRDTDQSPDRQPALTNLSSVLAADLVIWNSHWNKQSFLDGMQVILRSAPDSAIHNWRDRIEEKSTVIWPPVEVPTEYRPLRILHNLEPSGGDTPIRVVWPHRWEHDKGPDELLQIAEKYTETLNIRWTILGEQFPETPSPLREFKKRFANQIDHYGYEPDRKKYWQHLAKCDWVLSTANHEFFGIAVVEALFAGCLPWLPNRLSYPEILPEVAHGQNPPSQLDTKSQRQIREAVQEHLQPCLAENAVATIDSVLVETVENARLNTPYSKPQSEVL